MMTVVIEEMLKRFLSVLTAVFLLLLSGCASSQTADIAATTLPVYEFTARLCQNTDLTVTRLVTQNVSCLHDYTLNVQQARAAEAAQLIVISGAGLEDFMADTLAKKDVIDSSEGIQLMQCHHDHAHGHDHIHQEDAHIWLSPENAAAMAKNICKGLSDRYPQHVDTFSSNLTGLLSDIDAVKNYGESQLTSLSCRELLTFHDGFSYLADAFGLTIVEAIEEESGSEASAALLKELIGTVGEHNLPAIFTERSGSTSAAEIIAAETGVKVCTLDTAMAGTSWFDAMYHNIDTLKEALE